MLASVLRRPMFGSKINSSQFRPRVDLPESVTGRSVDRFRILHGDTKLKVQIPCILPPHEAETGSSTTCLQKVMRRDHSPLISWPSLEILP